ncbi:MAG TPA: DNA mismatch repair endonuclease MutL [Polyangiales bacterium]
MSIRVLPDDLADQIAAGEVVERPASVVKELIENAIDAGAQRVAIDVEDGGLRLIRVSDDGSGMRRADAALSVQRHATSKLRSRDDLFAIRTLGFRGEALPSIASVSRFSLSTRPRDEDVGSQLEIEGGAQVGLSEIGCAPGTRVEVRDLFFNVPARLKFLKSKPTESAHVASACLRAALAYPELALSLQRDGRAVHDFLAHQDLMERVGAAFRDEPLQAYEGAFDGATLRAALGAPERARSGAANLHLFVNRRPVRDPTLARCVAFAYGSVLPPGRFPIGALYLELDPSEVDVNVHPQKLEVRFARGRALLDGLTRCLAQKLGTSAWRGPSARPSGFWAERLPVGPAAVGGGVGYARHEHEHEHETDGWGLSDGVAPAADRVAESIAAFGAISSGDDGGRLAAAISGSDLAESSALGARGFFSSLRVLGQARRTFLVCEGASGITIIDQHAADERVRFDRLRRSYARREVRTQRLLFPERVECSELEATLVEQRHDELAQLGLECGRLGANTVAVSSVPALLTRAAPKRLLHDLFAELTRTGERAFADRVDMALATMACHASVRAGDPLSEPEQSALLRSLDSVDDFQGHCAHGRPILCTLRFDELEHRLGR